MFMEPTDTQFDLKWRMFGIPVRVHPFFWLMAVLFGTNALDRGLEYLLIWVACVFVSILIHELGHALTAKQFGLHPHVVLYGFGGLAINVGGLNWRWQRIAVSLAGPFAGFALLGLVIWIDAAFPLQNFTRLAGEILWDLWAINLFWGLVNLLPVWPLDGGHVSREVLTAVNRRDGGRWAMALSMVVAGVLAINALARMARFEPTIPYAPGGWWVCFLFGMLAFGSYQLLQQEGRRPNWDDDSTPWERYERDREEGPWKR